MLRGDLSVFLSVSCVRGVHAMHTGSRQRRPNVQSLRTACTAFTSHWISNLAPGTTAMRPRVVGVASVFRDVAWRFPVTPASASKRSCRSHAKVHPARFTPDPREVIFVVAGVRRCACANRGPSLSTLSAAVPGRRCVPGTSDGPVPQVRRSAPSAGRGIHPRPGCAERIRGATGLGCVLSRAITRSKVNPGEESDGILLPDDILPDTTSWTRVESDETRGVPRPREIDAQRRGVRDWHGYPYRDPPHARGRPVQLLEPWADMHARLQGDRANRPIGIRLGNAGNPEQSNGEDCTGHARHENPLGTG